MNMTTKIIGTGSALPGKVITNEDLSRLVDTNDQWIQSRTGIRERRIVGEGESTVTLGVEAGRRALENAQVGPEEIDLVLVATSSGSFYFPNTACQIQGRLHMKNAVAMDVSAACSGFLFILNIAHAYLQSGLYQRILLVGVDTLSRLIDWEDRSTCVLFGDGAGACVVESGDTGLVDCVLHTDGEMGQVLSCQAASLATPAVEAAQTFPVYMDGQAVFKFAVKRVPESILQLLGQNRMDTDSVQWYLLHQANRRILQSVAKRLHQPEEKFPVNLDRYGNTTAGTLPILLDEMNRDGRLKRGDRCVIAGFGAGLTWGAAVMEW